MLIDLEVIRARAAKRGSVANSASLRIEQQECEELEAEARIILLWTDDDVAEWRRDLVETPQWATAALCELLAFVRRERQRR